MHASSVVLVAIFTAAITSVGTVYIVQRYQILPAAEQVAETVVPDLKGLAEADARKSAQAVHLELFIAGREPSKEHNQGTVVRQSIPAGQRVPREHPVSVVLAEALLEVPDLKGLSIPIATQKLKEAGYELKLGENVPSAEVKPDHVVEQTPAAGSDLKQGSAVTVKTSSGAPEVEVPKLVGRSHADAKADLEKLGLEPQFAWVDMAETTSYQVIRQKPAAGEKLKPGDSVQVVVTR